MSTESKTPRTDAASFHANNSGPFVWAHVARQLETELAAERAAHEETKRLNICDVCGGSGRAVSGIPCMCNGTGRMSEAVEHIRECLFEAQAERDALQQRLAMAHGEMK